MQPKHLKALVKKVGKKEGTLTGVIGSTADPDRYGDIVNQNTWQLDNFKSNPVILWAHNASFSEDRPPIGKATRVEVKDGSLEFDIAFDMDDEFAASIHRKYAAGFLSAFSVGFIPHNQARSEDGKTILLDNELLELSAVPVPANPNALNQLRTLSFSTYESFDKFLDTDKKVETDDDEEQDTADLKSLNDGDVVKIATKVADLLASKGIKTVDSASEDKKGDGKAEKSHSPSPTSPQLGATPKIVAVMREATKQFQATLAEVNREIKGN